VNVSIRNFGSYADGFIRSRKMYVFPHPITIDPSGLGRQRLIVPQSWNIGDPRLVKVSTLIRTVAAQAVDSFTFICMAAARPTPTICPTPMPEPNYFLMYLRRPDRFSINSNSCCSDAFDFAATTCPL
jgi:hypothetical protein